jgi:hypothetical protein
LTFVEDTPFERYAPDIQVATSKSPRRVMLQGAAAAWGHGLPCKSLPAGWWAPEVAVLDDDHCDWMAARPEINSAAINKNDRIEGPLVRYFGLAATSIRDGQRAENSSIAPEIGYVRATL